jgi:hypothetical protein
MEAIFNSMLKLKYYSKYSHMLNGQRTFSHLAAELKQVYGCTADSVFSIYVKHNPLKYGQGMMSTSESEPEVMRYWEHTRRFLEYLHSVLYAEDHELSLHKLKPESYFFLTKICIDHAFDITELINIRNDKERKYAKDMANDISHHILPPYLTFRKQTLYCRFDGASLGPGMIAPDAQFLGCPMPQQMMPQQMPMMPQMMMPQQMPMMPQMMPMQPPSLIPRPIKKVKVRPTIRIKPTCIREGEEYNLLTESLEMPAPTDSDDVPLNFYSVYCTERTNKVNSSAETHHVPQIFPVPNRPPPPTQLSSSIAAASDIIII